MMQDKTGLKAPVPTFKNIYDKIQRVLDVMGTGEWVDGFVITARLRERGYQVIDGHVSMFIYYNMEGKYVESRRVTRPNKRYHHIKEYRKLVDNVKGINSHPNYMVENPGVKL